MSATRAAIPLARAAASLVGQGGASAFASPVRALRSTTSCRSALPPASPTNSPLSWSPRELRPGADTHQATAFPGSRVSHWASSGLWPRHLCVCEAKRGEGEPESEGVRNETEGGRSSEWMGNEREVEVASKLIAKWKQEKKEGTSSSSSSSSSDSASLPTPPPQEALLQAVSDLSRIEGREAKTTNVVMGGTATTDYGHDWLELDKKVNKYPSWRGFTAIGTGGEDFVDSMVGAVESVVDHRIPKWQVSARESAKGRYVSVKIGPIRVESSDQVRAVYEAMKKDERMRYFL